MHSVSLAGRQRELRRCGNVAGFCFHPLPVETRRKPWFWWAALTSSYFSIPDYIGIWKACEGQGKMLAFSARE